MRLRDCAPTLDRKEAQDAAKSGNPLVIDGSSKAEDRRRLRILDVGSNTTVIRQAVSHLRSCDPPAITNVLSLVEFVGFRNCRSDYSACSKQQFNSAKLFNLKCLWLRPR
jgi:hypothetical protein